MKQIMLFVSLGFLPLHVIAEARIDYDRFKHQTEISARSKPVSLGRGSCFGSP